MKKISWFDIAIISGVVFLLFVLLISHSYNDIIITTRHGINFWGIVLRGDFLDFYQVNQVVSGNEIYDAFQGCAYNILVYIVFAIWNFPLALIMHFTNVDVMNNVACLTYAKLLPVMATLVTVYIMKKIFQSLEIPDKNKKCYLFIYGTSSLVISVIFITAQYDILSIIFQLLGIYAFINKKEKAFVIWFGIAFCFKFFAIIPFIPLLVLKYKKIVPWLKNIVLFAIPWILTELPFRLNSLFSSYETAVAAGGGMAKDFIRSMLYSSNVGSYVNLFVIIYIVLIVWCYLRKSQSDTIIIDCIWGCFVAYAVFFTTMSAYPYWSIMLAPFLVLVIAIHPQHIYVNLLLETVALAAMVFRNMLIYNWCYFGNTLKPMIWSKILQGSRYDLSFEGSWIYSVILNLSGNGYLHVVLASVALATLGAISFISYPRSYVFLSSEIEDVQDVLLVRMAINAGICILPILAIFI